MSPERNPSAIIAPYLLDVPSSPRHHNCFVLHFRYFIVLLVSTSKFPLVL